MSFLQEHRQNKYGSAVLHNVRTCPVKFFVMQHGVVDFRMQNCRCRGNNHYTHMFLHMFPQNADTAQYCISFSQKYCIARNFLEHQFSRITNTNKHARKKFHPFCFCNKVTMSDHTAYNFPQGNDDPQHVFQSRNDSKILLRLSKRVDHHQRKTAVINGGSFITLRICLSRSCGDNH